MFEQDDLVYDSRRPIAAHDHTRPTTERDWIKRTLIGVAIVFMLAVIVLPLVLVFVEAFRKGAGEYFAAFGDPQSQAAIRLTLLVAAIAVPFNLVFGVAAAWCVAKFEFPGKAFLTTLIDLPFSVSPVVSGMVYVLLFGAQSVLSPFLKANNIEIIFAVQDQGNGDEEAALSLGANGWQVFMRVTLPNIKWGLLYGVLLCNARAMGEFGAVSVVSGHIRGKTTTMPLDIEILYNEYNFTAAFAVASLLALLALVTLLVKTILEFRYGDELAGTRKH